MTTTSLPHICNCCPNSTQQPLFCWLQHLWLGQLLSLPPPLPNHTHWSGLIRGQCHCSLPLFLPCTKSLEAGKGTNHRIFNLMQATSSHDETYLVVFVKNTCLWWSLHSLSFLGPWPQLLRRSQCRHLPAPCPRPSFASAVTLSLWRLNSICPPIAMQLKCHVSSAHSARRVEQGWIVHEIVNCRREGSESTGSYTRSFHTRSETKQALECAASTKIQQLAIHYWLWISILPPVTPPP